MNIEKSLLKASEQYADLTILRSLISAIPYIGGSIDVLLSGKASKIQSERIMKALELLKSEFETVSEHMIDSKYLESEEFYDILIHFFEKIVRTNSKNKIQYYVKILKSDILKFKTNTESSSLLETLSELSNLEVLCLGYIYNHVVKKEDSVAEDNLNKQEIWVNADLLNELLKQQSIIDVDSDFILLRLEKSGFVKEKTGSYIGYAGGAYNITFALRNLMKIITEKKYTN